MDDQKITYMPAKTAKGGIIYWVSLGRRIVGLIQRHPEGYVYTTKGSKTAGAAFPTLAECKRSLEAGE